MKIHIIDDLHPEDCAMVQALQSRSPAPTLDLLKKVEKAGSGKFMEKYYVGYGHKSIGDCGSTTISVDSASMLLAKAIQNNPLYCGQESSTRYIDYANMEPHDPIGTTRSDYVLESLLKVYTRSLPKIEAHVRAQHPIKNGEKKSTYDRAVKARTFDIARCLLPAGTTTNLSWHTNLRQAYDGLCDLVANPLQEVRTFAKRAFISLSRKYPHSFNQEDWDRRLEGDSHRWLREFNYSTYYAPQPLRSFICDERDAGWGWVNLQGVSKDSELLRKLFWLRDRPRGQKIPHWVDAACRISFDICIDFGSFRDLQRHRNGAIRMPILTTNLGFDPWYIENMPEDVQEDVKSTLESNMLMVRELDCHPLTAQYFYPMGYQVLTNFSTGIPGMIYFLELRTSKRVHPTLRRLALMMSRRLEEIIGDHVRWSYDKDPDDWTVRRGEDTIMEK